jgi:hypothetical protein
VFLLASLLVKGHTDCDIVAVFLNSIVIVSSDGAFSDLLSLLVHE